MRIALLTGYLLLLVGCRQAEQGSADSVALHDVSMLALPEAAERLSTSPNGKALLPYLVRCALPQGDHATVEHEILPGAVGLAPHWKERPLVPAEQRWVSACVLASMNFTGEHVEIGLAGHHPELPLRTDGNFTFREGAFYGNLFLKQPESYACAGDADVGRSPTRAKRRCTESAGDGTSLCGMALVGRCEQKCSRAMSGQGFGNCASQGGKYQEIVTVFLAASS